MNNTKKKLYVNMLFSIGAIFALLYFGAVYLVAEEKKLSLEIINKKKRIKQLESQNEQIGEIRSAYKNWQDSMNYVSNSVVNYSELFNYIIEIENLADENNVKLEKDVSVKNKKQLRGDFLRTYYKIKVSGSFNNVMRFLFYLENLKYYSDVENIRIISEDKSGIEGDDTNSGKVILSADLKIYARN